MSESNTNNVLSIEDLSVEFRTRDSVVHAVNRLELKIEKGKALGLVARQNRIAVTVFDLFNRYGHEVTRLHGHFAAIVLEFIDGHIGFGLQAGVNDYEVVVNAHHFSRDDFALAHFLTS